MMATNAPERRLPVAGRYTIDKCTGVFRFPSTRFVAVGRGLTQVSTIESHIELRWLTAPVGGRAALATIAGWPRYTDSPKPRTTA